MKILLTLFVVIVGIVVIRLVSVDNRVDHDGSIYVYITGINQETVFEGELTYEEGDSFFDVINKHFDLTCATQTYEEDPTCESSHAFQFILDQVIQQGQSKIILGIKGETFELMTDWNNTFLAFYHYDDNKKSLSTSGVSNIYFQNGSKFMICFENVNK